MGDINHTERLARWICKSLSPGTEVETGEVHRLIAEFQGRQGHSSQTWSQQVEKEGGDIGEAVQLAMSKGWIADRCGRLSITDSGAQMARHSRASPRKKRVSF